jgi:hypothetical protein
MKRSNKNQEEISLGSDEEIQNELIDQEEQPEVRYQVPENYQIDQKEMNIHNIKQKKKQTRWDQLYQLNKIQRETKEYFHQALKDDVNKKELEDCTFQPKLNKNSKKLSNKETKKSFYQRKTEWKKTQENKIKLISESKEDKDLIHCTFQPKLKKNKAIEKDENTSIKALDKFVERQKQARKEKMRKLAILNGDTAFDKKTDKNSSYASKFVKKKQEDDQDPVLSQLRKSSFSNCVLSLHKHLNSFDINLD